MKKELQNKLYENYPKIFTQKDWPETDTCMCWGICVKDGWYHILDVLCMMIQTYALNKNLNIQATQVKEKFGQLRFYYVGGQGDKYIEGLIAMTSAIATVTCERCGAPGSMQKPKGGSWVEHALCKTCL
jgi:hypothetical protein